MVHMSSFHKREVVDYTPFTGEMQKSVNPKTLVAKDPVMPVLCGPVYLQLVPGRLHGAVVLGAGP